MDLPVHRRLSPSWQWLAWPLAAAVLLVAPLLFDSGASLSLLSLTGTLMIFALSYNMLLGQGGMLSFGHAVYSGLGAFCVIHAIRLAGDGVLPVPLTLMPLVGALAGMISGALLGFLSTRRAGTTFAMISLGIVELVYASSLMFPGFFGGEAGVSADRVVGEPVFGISYGPQIEVYYLIAGWLLASTVAMYALTQTPLGRIVNAVRDNPERAEFIGYNPQRVRWLQLMLSGCFAGISGALSAIHFEIVSAENVSLSRSGAVLVFTFIGGAGHFFGPLLGAMVGVLMTVILPEHTRAWPLYLGLFFMLMVMHAPGGLAGLLMAALHGLRSGRWRQLLPTVLGGAIAATVALCGAVVLIEMLYHWSLESAQGPTVSVLGMALDTRAAGSWATGVLLLVAGVLALRRIVRPAGEGAAS